MNTVAGILLTAFAILVFNQARAGTLGRWMRAKFLNQKAG